MINVERIESRVDRCPHCGKDINTPPPHETGRMLIAMIAVGPIITLIVASIASLYERQIISVMRWLTHLF